MPAPMPPLIPGSMGEFAKYMPAPAPPQKNLIYSGDRVMQAPSGRILKLLLTPPETRSDDAITQFWCEKLTVHTAGVILFEEPLPFIRSMIAHAGERIPFAHEALFVMLNLNQITHIESVQLQDWMALDWEAANQVAQDFEAGKGSIEDLTHSFASSSNDASTASNDGSD